MIRGANFGVQRYRSAMKRQLFAIIPALTMLAACTAAPADPAPTVEPTTTEAATEVTTEPEPEPTEDPTTEEPTGPVIGSHGYIAKDIGEEAGIAGATAADPWLLTFTVDEIVPGFECDYDRPDPSANGQFVGLHFTVSTDAGWVDAAGAEFDASAHDLVAFVDDTRVNDQIGNAALCLADASRLPRLGSGQSAAGWIVIDVPTDATSVAYVPFWGDGSTGWEWQIP